MRQNITIHIGMPKAASTTLQRNFFARLPGVKYLCFTPDSLSSRPSSLLSQLLHDPAGSLPLELIKNELRDYFRAYPVSIISNENILMPGAALGAYNEKHRLMVATRLKHIFPEARILLVIRNQETFFKSMYTQILFNTKTANRNKHKTFQSYIDQEITAVLKGYPSIFKVPDYKAIIQGYSSLFTALKVVVLEEIKLDFKHFLQADLAPFLGLERWEVPQNYTDFLYNRRHSKADIVAKKVISKGLAIMDHLGNPHKILPENYRSAAMKYIRKGIACFDFWKVKTEYTPDQLSFLRNYYATSNQWVSAYLGKDLAQFDYPMGQYK